MDFYVICSIISLKNRDLIRINCFDVSASSHFKDSKELVLSGFRKAHISEADAEAANLAHLCENPLQDIDAVDGTS